MSGAGGARRSTAADIAHVAPDPAQAALRGLCPRCGAKTLFAGLIKFAPRCPACGLDFDAFNVGDGAAAFGTLLIGGLVVTGAVVVQIVYAPPLWVQIAVWFPVTLALVLATLRVAKAALLAAEFRNAAREGRIQP